MNHNAIGQQLITAIGETYGADAHELSLDSRPGEDIELLGNVEEFARFVHRLNEEFELDLKPQEVAESIQAPEATLHDLVFLIEDAMLG